MPHLFSGLTGIFTGLATLAFVWLIAWVMTVRAGEKEHHFCRSIGHQQSIFSGAAHTYTLAAVVNPQSRRREFSRCVFNHAKGLAPRAASRNQERRRKRPQLSS